MIEQKIRHGVHSHIVLVKRVRCGNGLFRHSSFELRAAERNYAIGGFFFLCIWASVAVDRMERYFSHGERHLYFKESIVLFGDYDVDGVSSIALLTRLLEGYGLEPRSFLPTRLKEGYGLSTDNIHSPNEKFHLDNFWRGIRTSAILLTEAAK